MRKAPRGNDDVPDGISKVFLPFTNLLISIQQSSGRRSSNLSGESCKSVEREKSGHGGAGQACPSRKALLLSRAEVPRGASHSRAICDIFVVTLTKRSTLPFSPCLCSTLSVLECILNTLETHDSKWSHRRGAPRKEARVLTPLGLSATHSLEGRDLVECQTEAHFDVYTDNKTQKLVYGERAALGQQLDSLKPQSTPLASPARTAAA